MPVYDPICHLFTSAGLTCIFRKALLKPSCPEYLEELGIDPENWLDIACGEGSLAVRMAERGYQMTGIDQSPQMIDLAKARAATAVIEVDFRVARYAIPCHLKVHLTW